MSFNKQNFITISEKYRSKYRIAEIKADERRLEVHSLVPEIAKIDRELSTLSADIMAAVMSGKTSAAIALETIRKNNEEKNALRKKLLVAAGYPADYTEPKYECEKCADTGYIDTSMCSCMVDALVKAGYETAGISAVCDRCTFDNFDLDYYKTAPEHYERMKLIYERAKVYAEGFSMRSQNLLLIGGTGLGKTHLSIAIAKKVVEKGYDVVYAPATALMSDFEYQRFGNSANGMEGADTSRYFNCELLIIDDLGTEINNQFTTNCLYNLINSRLNSGYPTVISTNLLSNDLRTRYWDRITSRIFGEYSVLAFIGKDIRMQKISR